MKIDKRLNLVLPIMDGDNVVAHVFSSPISKEVFETYFLAISKTFARIHGEGLNAIVGPRVAAMMLKSVAKEMPPRDDGAENFWEGPSGVALGLVAEIVRLSNVFLPAAKGGWQTIPLQEAADKNYISESDYSEVENALVFFTVASAMYPRNQLAGILDVATRIWGGRITSSTITEFEASLPTSTTAANTGVKTAEELSIPS